MNQPLPSFLLAWVPMMRKPLSIPELCAAWGAVDPASVQVAADAYASQGLFLRLDRPDGVHYALPEYNYGDAK
jgi:hypothetical protein